MLALCWNIQQGGGARRARIVEEITAYDPDVIALTGFRTRPGVALREALGERGWEFCETSEPPENRNGIAVFARAPLRRRPCAAPPGESARWLDLDLPGFGLGIGVLQIMAAAAGKKSSEAAAKIRFWDAVLAAAETRLAEPFLFLGDWNTGLHRLDEPGSLFIGADHFARLSALGWRDLWRHFNPGPTEFSWYWKAHGVRGNGYRVDHAFASPALAARVRGCRYSHAPRDAGISDHSMMLVEVE